MRVNPSVSKDFDSKNTKEELEPPGSGFCLGTLENIGRKKSINEDDANSLFGLNYDFSFKDIVDKTTKFRRRFYPEIKLSEWEDWRWQLRNRIKDKNRLERILRLTDNELEALNGRKGTLPFAITPYYASLLDPNNPAQPLRRTVVPVMSELLKSFGESEDPLEEEHQSPVPGIIHRYPDRVLFLVTDMCSTYCRYCTRSRMVGNKNIENIRLTYWQNAIDYIKASPMIRDVLVSGGDPLTLTDDKLNWLLSQLRQIPHIEMIRIGTKVPMVLPQRITPDLTNMLRRYHPLWMSIHVIHPDEITPEASQACNALADAGIPLGSQTVLLSGINDSVPVMKHLMHELLKIRIRPYYLYQCDPVIGSAHFRTSIEKGLEIISSLRGFTTGYGVPTYVIDAPGGGGKIPISPNTVISYDKDCIIMKNYDNKIYSYPNNIGHEGGETVF